MRFLAILRNWEIDFDIFSSIVFQFFDKVRMKKWKFQTWKNKSENFKLEKNISKNPKIEKMEILEKKWKNSFQIIRRFQWELDFLKIELSQGKNVTFENNGFY